MGRRGQGDVERSAATPARRKRKTITTDDCRDRYHDLFRSARLIAAGQRSACWISHRRIRRDWAGPVRVYAAGGYGRGSADARSRGRQEKSQVSGGAWTPGRRTRLKG